MLTANLPPILAAAYADLENDPQAQRKLKLKRELEAISTVVGQARELGASIPDVFQASVSRAGVTVGSDKVCPCCLRPFDVREP